MWGHWRWLRRVLSQRTFIKVLLVLVYAQMLIQQMEMRHHLARDEQHQQPQALDEGASSCCQSAASEAGGGGPEGVGSSALGALAGWLECVWTSAQACGARDRERAPLASRLREAASGALGALGATIGAGYSQLANADAALHSAYALWLARWRSPIVQRLAQSMLVQVAYTASMALAGGEPAPEFVY